VWADLQLPAGAGEDQEEPDEPVLPGQEHLDTRQVPQGHALGGLAPCGQAAGENRQGTVLRIRIRKIHKFLGLLDPDPVVRGTDTAPDPSIIKQKIVRKTLILTVL
jgi:hypothetical protein